MSAPTPESINTHIVRLLLATQAHDDDAASLLLEEAAAAGITTLDLLLTALVTMTAWYENDVDLSDHWVDDFRAGLLQRASA